MDLDKVKKGKSVCYHKGNLAVDRKANVELTKLANELYKRSTGTCESMIPSNDILGTGEFILYQKRIRDKFDEPQVINGEKVRENIYYEYHAKRVK